MIAFITKGVKQNPSLITITLKAWLRRFERADLIPFTKYFRVCSGGAECFNVHNQFLQPV